MSLHGLTTTAVQADLGHDPHDTILWIPGVLHAGKQAGKQAAVGERAIDYAANGYVRQPRVSRYCDG